MKGLVTFSDIFEELEQTDFLLLIYYLHWSTFPQHLENLTCSYQN